MRYARLINVILHQQMDKEYLLKLKNMYKSSNIIIYLVIDAVVTQMSVSLPQICQIHVSSSLTNAVYLCVPPEPIMHMSL